MKTNMIPIRDDWGLTARLMARQNHRLNGLAQLIGGDGGIRTPDTPLGRITV